MIKMFFKKSVAFFLAALIGASALLCGCGKNGGDDGADLPELIIGSDYYEPFIYRDYNGDFIGFDVELAQEVCRIMGCKAKFVGIDWEKKNEYLERGEIDCLWGCFSLTGREAVYSWTLPYLNSRQVVAVAKDSCIKKIADLEGKRVAVQMTSKPDEIFSGKISGQSDIPALKALNCFTDMAHVFAAISDDYVDAIAGHEEAFLAYMQSSTVQLKILSEPLLEVQVGVAFLKGKETNADVIAKMNEAFVTVTKNGYMKRLAESYGFDSDTSLVDYEKTR